MDGDAPHAPRGNLLLSSITTWHTLAQLAVAKATPAGWMALGVGSGTARLRWQLGHEGLGRPKHKLQR
jgi:hypothetical protein